MILIVSSQNDVHAQAVMRELAALGSEAQMLDLSHYPQKMCLSWHYANGERRYILTTPDGRASDLAAYRVIWWRRPQSFDLHEQLSHPEHQQFAYAEIHEAFSGMWPSLNAFWINDPTRDDVAHHKVYQLRVAQDVGLQIPETLITSSPDNARAFAENQGIEQTVYKPFSATEQHWRETRLLKAEEMALIENVTFAPVIFQEYIPAVYDLRITVVGEETFASAIYSQETSYKVDMRMDIASARIAPADLPQEVTTQLKAFMDRLGLVYGAIDMRLTPDGAYVFLEINPAGQWLFIEEETKQPISAAMARLMIDKAR